MAEELPEGYIARGKVNALDSRVLARTGQVHEHYTNQPGNPMDSFVEFDINGDSRLNWMRSAARGLRNKYANPESADYIQDVQQREKTITNELMPLVYSEYGSYSDDTLKNDGNAGERKADGLFGYDTVYLKDMEKDSLVCRHYAPIISVLLDDAGVRNDLVASSDMQGYRTNEAGKLELIPDEKLERHMYVITREGNAVVEATTAEQYANGSTFGNAYKPIRNDVTAKDIVYSGQAAVTDYAVYAGHSGNGNQSERWVAASREGALERYNDQRQQQIAEVRAEQEKRSAEIMARWEQERQERREQRQERMMQRQSREQQGDGQRGRRPQHREGAGMDGREERIATLREETRELLDARREYVNAGPRQREERKEALKEARSDFLKAVVDMDGDGKFTRKDLAKIDRNQDGTIDRREIQQFRQTMTPQAKEVMGKVLGTAAREAGVDNLQKTDNFVKTLESAGVKLEGAPADNKLTAAGVTTDEKAKSPMDDKMRAALAQFNDPSAKQDTGTSIPGQMRQQGQNRTV